MTSRIRSYFITAMVVVFAGLAMTATTAWSQVNLRGNVPGNEEGISYLGAKYFADLVAQRTDGQVNIKVHHSSALGDQVSSIESMQAGTLDIATVETPITTVDPVLGATALPYVFRGREHVAQALGGAGRRVDRGTPRGQGPARARLPRRRVPADHQQHPADQHSGRSEGRQDAHARKQTTVQMRRRCPSRSSTRPCRPVSSMVRRIPSSGPRRPSSTKCRSIFPSPITSTPSPTC